MNWFKKLVVKWVREDWETAQEENCKVPSNRLSTRAEESACSDDPVLNFKVYSAVGGKVAEFRRYNRKSDRSDSTTYIITDEQDFGECISKIATMERLKL